MLQSAIWRRPSPASRITTAVRPDALATALRSTGFSLVQTANSYTIQNGLSGLERTKTILRSVGLTPVGTYESAEDRAQNRAVLVEANGIRIAVVAFTKGMNGMRLPSGAEYCTNLLYTDYDSNYSHIDTDGITAAIDAARALSPDIIVAALHWGSEDVSDISDTQEKIADLMFRRGVDVIVGARTLTVSAPWSAAASRRTTACRRTSCSPTASATTAPRRRARRTPRWR